MLTIVLSDHEKLAGRHYREIKNEALVRLNEESPPTYSVMTHWAQYRHLCSARRGISTALELKEIYEVSPEYAICLDADNHEFAIPSNAIPSDATLWELIPSGTFAYWYKEGKCRGCGQTGRSKVGVCKPAVMRPPLVGRVGRASA